MAVAGNWQFDLNGFTFNAGATPAGLASGSSISITELTGMDTPDVNSTVSVRTNQHGSFVTAKYHKERVLVFSGRLNTTAANYAPDSFVVKQAFLATLAPVRLTFQLPGMPLQYVNVSPHGVRMAVTNVATAVGWADFIATLVAGDPRIYAATGKSSTNTTGTFSLTNAGTFNAPVTYTFNGPLTNPTITNTTTGQGFALTITLSTGDTLVVSTLGKTVYYTPSGGSQVTQYSALSTTSVFPELAPGVNSITFGASAGTGNVVVAYSDTWL